MKQELIKKCEELLKDGKDQVVFVYDTGERYKHRIFLDYHSGKPCVKRPRSRKYGSRLVDGYDGYDKVVEVVPVIHRLNTEEQKWLKVMNNIQKRLEASGLWKDILADVKLAISIGMTKIKQAEQIYWEREKDVDYYEMCKRNVVRIKEVDPRLVKVDEKGEDYVDTGIIWPFDTIPKVKKMYFGRDRKDILAQIKDALAKKEKYNSGRITVTYDVTFEYNPEINSAWYSEEYRNCGNGHYYLALDATHAVFWEDD